MKNSERISKLKSCSTVGELVEEMWPSVHDSCFRSWAETRRLTAEWIECYKEGICKPTYKYDTPSQLAEGIYPTSWDDSTMLFQELRVALVEWIDTFAGKMTTKSNQ